VGAGDGPLRAAFSRTAPRVAARDAARARRGNRRNGVSLATTDLVAIAWLALFVAFASASQDIVVDAYRTDVSSREERGLAGALGVVGYRLAMLASGALALVLVAGSGWIPALGWRDTYLLMAALMVVGIVAVFWGEEPSTAPAAPKTLRDAVIEPLREFFSRPKAGWILVLLVLYKLGDAFAGSLTTAFLLRGAGFSLDDVGYVNKAVGLASTIVGVLFGGALMVRLGLYRALLGFGILQAVSILAFMWLALVGKSYPIMVFAWASRILPGAWARRRSWRC